MQDILKVYQQALLCWKQGELDEAATTLHDYWQRTGMYSLNGKLLLAYILRDKKKYISEIKVLYELLEEFSACSDKKLLADTWSLLGSALRMIGESKLSVEAFVKSVALEPNPKQKLVEGSNALFSANAVEGVTAHYMQALYELYRNLLKGLEIEPYLPKMWNHPRIRIGYISADFRNHAVGQFVSPLFLQCDYSRFDVYAYSLSHIHDKVTRFLQNSGAVWRDMAGDGWDKIAKQVRQDEIDILVDLSGHTAGNGLPVFAWHPAPVQISGIGYFNSTGIYETTGFLSDKYCAPVPNSPYFTEPLLQLPHSHFCYQPFSEFPDIEEIPAKEKGCITFGCFNNFAKVTDSILKLWGRILIAVPDSKLLLKHSLLGESEGRDYTFNRLQRLGLPMHRIEMRGLSDDYLEQYKEVDIALDTSPYPGGLTTFEALYMGVPVISLAGNRHGARFGYSILSNVGLPELVADTEKAYFDIAVHLANDYDLLKLLHDNLRSMMIKSPLMDAKQYMNDLEKLYVRLLSEAREGMGLLWKQ